MEISQPSEIPWNLKRLEIDENLVQLRFQRANIVTHSKGSLEKNVLQQKNESDLNISRYILNTKDYAKSVQFYMDVNPTKVVFLTAPNYTSGLSRVPPGSVLLIKNLAYSKPIYLFRCLDSNSKNYLRLTDTFKALVNKAWIKSDFQQRSIGPSETVRLSPNSVYFLYTNTHSKFKLEYVDQSGSSLPKPIEDSVKLFDIGSKCSEGQCNQLEEINGRLMSEVLKLSKEIIDLTDKNGEQEKEIEELESENRVLDSRCTAMKRKLELYENMEKGRELKRARLTTSSPARKTNSPRARKKPVDSPCILL